ncbi:MAG: hypothetical protein HY782_11325 [Chloroflexi bacterium]|nr:hypothetical protein [Chloroflexota bacterium]
MVRRPLFTLKTKILILLVALVIGALMASRADLQFGLPAAILTAFALGLLGWLISNVSAKRR